MIPAVWAAKFLPYKWIAIAVVLAITAAWGGIGWYGKATAERTLAAERLEQARVVADQLAANQHFSEAQARRAADISEAYQKGKRDVATAFQPAMADLQMLRTLFAGGAGRVEPGGLREPGPDGSGPVPGPADPTGGTHATACTDRPGDLIAAAHRVAQDLESCAVVVAQLTSLQRWVLEVGQAKAASP